jgi:RNA polymerase sigma-70 factor, ECF subfamily
VSAEFDRPDRMGAARIEPAVDSGAEAERRRHVDELLREHGEFLRRLAARLCRSVFDPDDLMQDVLERTVQAAHTLLPDHDHRAWMARVMRNLFIDRLRRRAALPDHSALEEDTPTPPVEECEWWEGLTVEDLRARIGELPKELRGTFELSAFEGCTYAEIAARLGIPKMTVGTRLLRARRRLKQIFIRSRGS